MTTTASRASHRTLSMLLVATSAFGAAAAGAAVFNVGTGATCDGPNDHATIAAAFAAARSSPGPDEVRLTRTLTYVSPGLDFVDFVTDPGPIVVAGGFDDCDDAAPSGRTTLSGGAILVDVAYEDFPAAPVTLRALELTGATDQAVRVWESGVLYLEDVWIHHNRSGVGVLTGGKFHADATTSITDHSDFTRDGNGIHCQTPGSEVHYRGNLERNQSREGGAIYLTTDCAADIYGGAVISGLGESATDENRSADYGGAIAVRAGATLRTHGGADRVVIRDHYAANAGGGIDIAGVTEAVLHNTLLLDNSAGYAGGGMRVAFGAQVTMDRVGPCPYLISCSEIRGNSLRSSGTGVALAIEDAQVDLRNTILSLNEGLDDEYFKLVDIHTGGTLNIDGLGVNRNSTRVLFAIFGASQIVAQYVTVARNAWGPPEALADPEVVEAYNSVARFDSSIFADTIGAFLFDGGTVIGDCLLVDDATNLEAADTTIGTAEFISAGTGDLRQLVSSPSVDFCDEAAVSWPGRKDIELHRRGLDAATNGDGSPGVPGGRFDVGFDEWIPATYIFWDDFESGDFLDWNGFVG